MSIHSTVRDALVETRDLFDVEYEYGHPKPESDRSRWIDVGILAMLTASVVVSSSETVPFFIGRNNSLHPAVAAVVAISVVVMIEIAIIITSHLIVRFSNGVKLKVIYLLFAGLVIALSVAISANVVGQLERRDLFVDENFNSIVSIIAAASAPLMALISGVVFAFLERFKHAELAEWQRKKNIAWARYKTTNDVQFTIQYPSIPASTGIPYGMEQMEIPKQIPNSIPNGNGNVESGYGFQRNSSALEKALEHYRANPSDLESNPIDIANEIGIGKSTMYKARKIMQENSDLDDTD